MSPRLNTILGWIDRQDREAPRYFRRFALSLLTLEAERQGRPFVLTTDPVVTSRFEFDALLPKGIGNSALAVGVTVVYFPPGRASATQLNDHLARLSLMAARRGFGAAALVHNVGLGGDTRDIVERFRAQLPPRPEVHEWGPQRLGRYLGLNEGFRFSDMEDAPNELRAKKRLAPEPKKDPADRLEEQLNLLHGIYERDGLSLFIGAGMSADAGIPQWNAFVHSLLVAVVGKELGEDLGSTDDLARVAEAAGRKLGSESPLILARYARLGLEGSGKAETVSFRELLTRILYGELEKRRPGPGSLAAKVARLCQPLRNSSGISSVVTYNFDDILEQRLVAEGVRHRSVYWAGDRASSKELAIYHVHGFLPRDPSGFPELEKSPLAFAEEGYHSLYRDPFHWTNVVQLHELRERTCLLIGLSLKDPNLRRLLDVSADPGQPRHFAILKRDSIDDFFQNPEDQVRREVGEAFLRTHLRLQERLYAELGVQVLWVERHEDIPAVLETIRGS